METTLITALLIEDNPDDAMLIGKYLNASRKIKYKVIHVERLADGLESLRRTLFDVILLDLGLPDGPMGIKTFEAVYALASGRGTLRAAGWRRRSGPAPGPAGRC